MYFDIYKRIQELSISSIVVYGHYPDYDEVKLTSLLLNWKGKVKYKLILRLGGHKLGTNLVEERKLGINPATAALLPSQSPIQQTNLESKSIISEIFDYFEGCGSMVGGCGSVVDFL